MLDIARSLKASGVPVRWMLADAGWADVSHGRSHHGQLWDFDADPGRFPGGIKPLIDRLKGELGISWVGVWHAFNGWWNGIDPRGPIARRLRPALIPCPGKGANALHAVATDSLMPDPCNGRGEAFYDAWYGELVAKGVDFVKVDNQGSMQATIAGRMPLFDAMTGQHANLVNAVRRRFGGRIIHCMAMSTESAYSWRDVAVARNSDDFIPGQALNHRDHAWTNAYNAPWTSRLAWPDYDMWESRHPHAEFHAVLRAVSGGPVYVTDKPGRIDARLLNRLVLPDGRLLRAREPAQPTVDCLFTSPHEHRIPLKLFAPAGPGAVIAAFNVHRAGGAVAGSVGPADARGLAGSRFALVEWKTRFVRVLRRSARVPLRLAPDRWALFMVVPCANGFAPIGLMDKYLPLAAVTGVNARKRSAEVDLASGGPFGFFSARRPRAVTVGCHRLAVRRTGNLRVVRVPGEAPVRISIVW